MVQQAGPGTPKVTRWMPWLVGVLLLAGLISAGVIVADDDRPEAVVSATGSQSGTVDVTSTVTVPLPVTSTPAPTTTLRTTTTLSPAAVAVLRAIASTTTTTRPPPTTTTTAPPAPTTTAVTQTTVAPPTTVRTPRFTVTMVNEHTHAFVMTVNGQDFPLAPGQSRSLVELPAVPVRTPDIVRVMAPGDEKCGVQEQQEGLFPDGSRWLLRIVTGAGTCTGDFAMPRLAISPL
jgi:hypothetical protein